MDCIKKNSYGRWEVPVENGGFVELTSGNGCKIFLEECDCWVPGRVEYSDEYGGYYFLGNKGAILKLTNKTKIKL